MKYKKIEDYIRNKIDTNKLRPGDQVDKDNKIVKEFGVSKLTVDKALINLAEEGYLIRIKGKGTFVKKRTWSDNAVDRRFHSLSEDIMKQGKKPGAKLIEYRAISAIEVPEIAGIFNLTDSDLIHYFIRVRTADGIPVAISYSYISAKQVPYIDLQILSNGSLWEFLANSGFEGTDKCYYTVEAKMPTEDQVKLLDISKDEPLLLSHHKSAIKDGTIYNYVDTYYVSSRYKYEYMTEQETTGVKGSEA